MEIAEISMSSFEDYPMPETLYKYRDWGNKYNRRVITHREVFFAAPTSFEDPLDCKNPIRYDLLSYEDILNKYFQDSMPEQPTYTTEELNSRIDFTIDCANNSNITNPVHLAKMERKHFNEFDSFSGVLCLTEYPAEITMWKKYSINHTGFCVGFEPKAMLKDIGTGGGIVQYYKELPIIYPAPKHPHLLQSYLQIYSKLEKWTFEKEYRTYIFRNYALSIDDRTFVLPPTAFKEIILGASMSKEDELSLIASIPPDLQHVKIKKAFLINDEIIVQDYDSV